MSNEQEVKKTTMWYRVVSTTPISVDYQNGRATALHYGCIFEASPGLPDVRRMLRMLPRPIVSVGPVAPPPGKGRKILPMPGPGSHMPANSSPTPKTNLPAGVHDLVRTWER